MTPDGHVLGRPYSGFWAGPWLAGAAPWHHLGTLPLHRPSVNSPGARRRAGLGSHQAGPVAQTVQEKNAELEAA